MYNSDDEYDVWYWDTDDNSFDEDIDELPDDSYYLNDNRSCADLDGWDWPTEEEHRRQVREEFEKRRNIKRDEKGRLNKGAKLAHKDRCNEWVIINYYVGGLSVKEIVKATGAGKSTIYNMIKKYKERTASALESLHISECNSAFSRLLAEACMDNL